MTRSLSASDLVTLPRLDANAAVFLASAIEAATLDDQKNPRTLPSTIADALGEVKRDRLVLQEVMGTPVPKKMVRPIDRLEDNAIGAFFGVLESWARVAGRIPQGDTALELNEAIFGGEDLSFLTLTPRKQWAVADSKLQVIEREGLEPKLATLGMLPLLAYLRDVHAQYGEVTGATKPLPKVESPKVGEALEDLLESLRHYVAAVVGSIKRKKPETQVLADLLLEPLASWESTPTTSTESQEAEETAETEEAKAPAEPQ